jgi:hypothetical protein
MSLHMLYIYIYELDVYIYIYNVQYFLFVLACRKFQECTY